MLFRSTVWIGLIVGIISVLLMFVGIGFIGIGLVTVWVLFRIIRGLIRAVDDRPIDNPQGWF